MKKSERETRQCLSVEARENAIIAAAVDRAEEQIRNGTASSQVITHYLKLGAARERDRLEIEKLRQEVELAKAKTEAIKAAKDNRLLVEEAIAAMKMYSGNNQAEEDPDEY